jgi:hypothetical protein
MGDTLYMSSSVVSGMTRSEKKVKVRWEGGKGIATKSKGRGFGGFYRRSGHSGDWTGLQ